MRTHMECRSLGENKSNYSTQESVRQIRQQSTSHKTNKSKSSSGNGALALGLLAGAAAGALAGVLLAPDKGTVMRKKVSDQASRLGSQVNKGYSSTKGKVSGWAGKMKGSKPGSQPEGTVKRSPYTDPGKWDDTGKSSTGNTGNTPPAL